MTVKPLTNRLFGKENIRQIVREWLEERKLEDLGDQKRLTKEIIEHNIEWFEQLFMKSLTKFVTDTSSFFITTVCYNNILNNTEDGLTEEYLTLLRYRVKGLFLGSINEKTHKLDLDFESYLCTKTIDDLFFEGEIYKNFDSKYFFYNRGLYGNKVELDGSLIEDRELFSLVPQQANRHLTTPYEWSKFFEKIE